MQKELLDKKKILDYLYITNNQAVENMGKLKELSMDWCINSCVKSYTLVLIQNIENGRFNV